MDKQEYGEKYQEHLMRQYELYVEMADRVTQRRERSNRFYSILLTGLLALVSAVAKIADWQISDYLPVVILLAVGVAGLSVCVLWFINVKSYRLLNSGKFRVIHQLEQQLPFPCYQREWEFLRPESGRKQYMQLTRIEQWIPFVLALPYCGLIGLCIFILLTT